MEKKSNVVKLNYVNRNAYPFFTCPVDKGCGKPCGECGKLAVFNSYFPDLSRKGRGCRHA